MIPILGFGIAVSGSDSGGILFVTGCPGRVVSEGDWVGWSRIIVDFDPQARHEDGRGSDSIVRGSSSFTFTAFWEYICCLTLAVHPPKPFRPWGSRYRGRECPSAQTGRILERQTVASTAKRNSSRYRDAQGKFLVANLPKPELGESHQE